MHKLVIDEKKVALRRKLFRMAKYSDLPIFERNLAEQIQDNGFSGIGFMELSEWQGA